MGCILTENTFEKKKICMYSTFSVRPVLLDMISRPILCDHNHTLFSDVDMAIENFKVVRKLDPYRLDNMDTYSNALYVKVKCQHM